MVTTGYQRLLNITTGYYMLLEVTTIDYRLTILLYLYPFTGGVSSKNTFLENYICILEEKNYQKLEKVAALTSPEN